MTRILIIGIGNPVPSFIQRRLEALANSGISLTVVAQHGQRIDLPNASIIRIGGTHTTWRYMMAFVNILRRPYLFFRMLSVRTELSLIQRLRWASKYVPLTSISAPDVIHLQWLSAISEFVWLRQFFNCPIIASARGSQVTVYPLTQPGYKNLIEQAIKLCDYIHCVSHDIARACERLGATPEKLLVNYNGIDLSKFCPVEIARDKKVFTIISVGSMMWRKGQYYQLQLLDQLQKEGRVVQLLWIGDGPDREGLLYTAHLIGVINQITLAGKVQASELPSWLNRADVYVSTSAAEGLANSVMEAAACGLPILAFTCEGMEEIVEPSVNGFILPFADINALFEKTIFVMDHSEERKKMGEASRQLAVDKFDEQRWVSHMIKTYKSLERK